MGEFNRGILRWVDLLFGVADLARNGGRIKSESVAG